jgi:S1-C subfamily serine protease
MESAKRKSLSAGWHWTLVLIAALLWPAVALGGAASEVFQKVKGAIVVVKALDREGQEVSQGSGVVLPSGEVVTNHHVVEKGVTLRVVAKGRSALALIVGQDPDRDLALLSVVGLDASPAQLGRTEGLKVGQRVFAVSAPYGLELSISEGIVSQLRGKKPPYHTDHGGHLSRLERRGFVQRTGAACGDHELLPKRRAGAQLRCPGGMGARAHSAKQEGGAATRSQSPGASPGTRLV